MPTRRLESYRHALASRTGYHQCLPEIKDEIHTYGEKKVQAGETSRLRRIKRRGSYITLCQHGEKQEGMGGSAVKVGQVKGLQRTTALSSASKNPAVNSMNRMGDRGLPWGMLPINNSKALVVDLPGPANCLPGRSLLFTARLSSQLAKIISSILARQQRRATGRQLFGVSYVSLSAFFNMTVMADRNMRRS